MGDSFFSFDKRIQNIETLEKYTTRFLRMQEYFSRDTSQWELKSQYLQELNVDCQKVEKLYYLDVGFNNLTIAGRMKIYHEANTADTGPATENWNNVYFILDYDAENIFATIYPTIFQMKIKALAEVSMHENKENIFDSIYKSLYSDKQNISDIAYPKVPTHDEFKSYVTNVKNAASVENILSISLLELGKFIVSVEHDEIPIDESIKQRRGNISFIVSDIDRVYECSSSEEPRGRKRYIFKGRIDQQTKLGDDDDKIYVAFEAVYRNNGLVFEEGYVYVTRQVYRVLRLSKISFRNALDEMGIHMPSIQRHQRDFERHTLSFDAWSVGESDRFQLDVEGDYELFSKVKIYGYFVDNERYWHEIIFSLHYGTSAEHDRLFVRFVYSKYGREGEFYLSKDSSSFCLFDFSEDFRRNKFLIDTSLFRVREKKCDIQTNYEPVAKITSEWDNTVHIKFDDNCLVNVSNVGDWLDWILPYQQKFSRKTSVSDLSAGIWDERQLNEFRIDILKIDYVFYMEHVRTGSEKNEFFMVCMVYDERIKPFPVYVAICAIIGQKWQGGNMYITRNLQDLMENVIPKSLSHIFIVHMKKWRENPIDEMDY